MKITRNKLIVVGMSFTTAIAFFASTAGTLAWYAYNTSVKLSYIGTSVRKSELIHIGLVDGEWDTNLDVDHPLTHKFTDEEVENFQLTRETCHGKSVVWTSVSTGFPVDAIKTYLERYGYAYNSLSPVSSKAREIDDDLNLYKSPDYGEINVVDLATTSQYVRLPFAFKTIGSDNENIKNKEIWLTDAVVETDQSDGRYINEAVRVFVENPTDQFLMNPNITENVDGYTNIGGMLDLDGDGTYDYNLGSTTEYIYEGAIATGSPTISDSGYDVPYSDARAYNLNGVEEKYQSLSTFYAKHKEGVKYVESISESNDYIKGVTFAKANYTTFGKIKPGLKGDGYFDPTTGRPITTTDDTYGIGYATLTIYLEGWDHSVVNAAIGYEFNLGLTFEIDKL